MALLLGAKTFFGDLWPLPFAAILLIVVEPVVNDVFKKFEKMGTAYAVEIMCGSEKSKELEQKALVPVTGSADLFIPMTFKLDCSRGVSSETTRCIYDDGKLKVDTTPSMPGSTVSIWTASNGQKHALELFCSHYEGAEFRRIADGQSYSKSFLPQMGTDAAAEALCAVAGTQNPVVLSVKVDNAKQEMGTDVYGLPVSIFVSCATAAAKRVKSCKYRNVEVTVEEDAKKVVVPAGHQRDAMHFNLQCNGLFGAKLSYLKNV